MQILTFGRDAAAESPAHGSVGLALSRVARIEGRTQISVVHLGAGGELGAHPATVNQLFMVVAGQGWVSGGGSERQPIQPGRAAFWPANEVVAAGTETGLIAVVVESVDLDPTDVMPAAE